MSEALQAWIAATPMFAFLATGLVCAGFAAQAFFAIHLGLSLAWTVYMAFSFGLALWLMPGRRRVRGIPDDETSSPPPAP